MSNGLSNVRVVYRNEVTVNLGNFENAKPSYELSADVNDGVHPDEAVKRLEALVDSWLENKVAEIVEENSA